MPNRVEREIEEILSKLDGEPPSARGRPPTRMRRSLRARVGRSISGWRTRFSGVPALSAGNVMLAGIALILGSLFIQVASSEVARWAVLLGLALFAGSFIYSLFFRNRGAGPVSSDAYWRGQRIPRATLRGSSLSDRLRGWWQGRNRRRR